jgi:hypothetical protein
MFQYVDPNPRRITRRPEAVEEALLRFAGSSHQALWGEMVLCLAWK